jgi:hypothetical protein
MSDTYIDVTVSVRITSIRAALREAAARVGTGMADDMFWDCENEIDAGNVARMLVDPNESPPGLEIIDSSAEVTHHD